MKFFNKIPSLLILLVCILVFGLFIYPGLYKYDKLNQKFPVKINRLTGETKVLTINGWTDVGDYDSAANEFDLSEENNASEDEVINFDAVRNRNKESLNTLSPNSSDAFFGKGDSPEKVQEIMGSPDSIIGSDLFEIWSYGQSKVHFKNGSVSGWVNSDMNLKLK